MWSRQRAEQNSQHAWVMRTKCELNAKFAYALVECEIFAFSSHMLEQLASEGHIFLISAPNRTRFEALDS